MSRYLPAWRHRSRACCAGSSRSALGYFLAGLFGAAGVLIKFPGLAVLAVFGMSALSKRRVGPLLAALGPFAAFLAWQAASRRLYGATQVATSLSFLGQFRTLLSLQIVERALTGLSILGLTCPLWLLAVPRLGRRGWLGSIVLTVLATATAAGLSIASQRWGHRPWSDTAFLFGVALGTFGTSAALFVVPRRSTTDVIVGDPRRLLWCWVLGIASIVIPFGPFVAVRSFLPIEPPLALLILLGRPRSAWMGHASAVGALGLSAVLGVTLGLADYRWAACYPMMAARLATTYGPSRPDRPVYFLGHWGWQYYAERAGLAAWDARRSDVPEGSIVVMPLRADRQFLHPEVARRFEVVGRFKTAANPVGLTLWNRGAGVRFYGGDFGEVPWGFADEPVEEFVIVRVGAR